MDTSWVVNTVLGPIPADQLGLTLSHEHLAMNPGNPAVYHDAVFDDVEKILPEVDAFLQAGGKTIVEMTPLNFGRDVLAYQWISTKTGLQVVCTTGFHKEEFIPAWVQTSSDAQVIGLLRDEIERGVGNTGIKPAVLKVGTSYNTITELERRIVRIASQVQRQTQVAISTHCDKGTMGLELCRLFLESGAEPGRVILGHVDIPNDVEYLKEMCALGFNVQIDHVGRDFENHDQVKIGMLKTLIDCGYIDQVFLSGDMGKRSYLKSYGGRPGLGYIPAELTKYMLAAQIGAAEIDHILAANPARVFGHSAEGQQAG